MSHKRITKKQYEANRVLKGEDTRSMAALRAEAGIELGTAPTVLIDGRRGRVLVSIESGMGCAGFTPDEAAALGQELIDAAVVAGN